MSAVIQQPLQPNPSDTTNKNPKTKIDPKPTSQAPAKTNAKKKLPISQQSTNGSTKSANQSSPYKGCVPIAAKPSSNGQVPLAPILAKPPGHKTLSPSQKTQPKQQPKQTSQPPQQLAPNNQPTQPQQQQQQQPRIIFNGNLQSILAAVGSNSKPQQGQPSLQWPAMFSNGQQFLPMPNNIDNQKQPIQKNTNLIAPAPPKPLNNSLNTSGGNAPHNTSMPDQSVVQQPASAPTVFTATTTADGQVILQSVQSQNPHQQPNQNMQQQLMQQNILSLIQQQQQQQQNPKPVQQNPYFFGQNQINQLIQQQHQPNIMQSQQQQQFLTTNQQFPNHIFTQPVAASTPTPQDTTSSENALLRQRLLHEEQRQQQLQQQLEQKKCKPNTSQNDLSLYEQSNVVIKPKKELNQSMSNDKMDIADDNTKESHLNSSDPIDKRRGRPRLYVKNPVTGKSIKGKRLDGSTVIKPTKAAKKSKLLLPSSSKQLLIKSLNKGALPSNSNGLFPSPSTSVSSSNSVKATPEALQTDTSSDVSSNEESEGSEAAVSDTEMQTAIVTDSDTAKTQQKVLTHVIEGFMIKESSKPFESETEAAETAQEPKTVFRCTECSSDQRQDNANSSNQCSEACAKRAARRELKKTKKAKKSLETPTAAAATDSSPTKTLEDTTNNLSSCMKSKCTHKHHKHRHRRHHTGSSSSSSSRDKIKKRMKLLNGHNSTTQQPHDINPPPILEFSTVSINQQPPKMTFQPVAVQQLNTFNSSALSQSYTSSADTQLPQGDPTEWNCEQVFEFVRCVAGVSVAQVFQTQEVDGSALALIRDDHLVNTMQIKLGPALKIMSKFNELKTKSQRV